MDSTTVLGARPVGVPLGCCDFVLDGADGTRLIAHTMELAIEPNSELKIWRRGKAFSSTAPDGQQGLTWTSKYGFVGFSGKAFDVNVPFDGMNEKGLCFGALSLHATEWQQATLGQQDRAIMMLDLGRWILSTFARCVEVKAALPHVTVWGKDIKELGETPGLHFAIHDATGASMVIEFLKGQAVFHDNLAGILTNDPIYPEQISRLRDLTSVSPMPAPDMQVGQFKVKSMGEGSGTTGMPGGWSSTDRFARLALMKSMLPRDVSGDRLWRAAWDHISNVDRTEGTSLWPVGPINCSILTRWASIRDPHKLVMQYRGNPDLTIRGVDLNKINFGRPKSFSLVPVTRPQEVVDMTSVLIGDEEME